MTYLEREQEANNIIDDIIEEHGMELLPILDLEDAIETVETYGHRGEDLAEIAKMVVSIMSGEIIWLTEMERKRELVVFFIVGIVLIFGILYVGETL